VSHRPGAIAEAAVRLALLEHGLRVLVPVADVEPYDLVVHTPGDRFVRMQVKHGRVRGGCVVSNACSTDHGRGRQSYAGRADVLAVYAAELRRTWIVPVEHAPRYAVSLRFEPARNNQVTGTRPAGDFTLERCVAGLAASAGAA
jgi:hypothetical protein